MSTAQYPDFPVQEYRQRYGRLRREMDRCGMDAVLITSETNHRYFDGFNAKVFSLYHYYFFSLLPRDEALQPTFLCAHGFDHICTTSWLPDIRFWDISPDFFMTKTSGGLQLVAEVIKEKDLAESTIGLEMSNDMHAHMGLDHFQQLRELTPGVKWVDSSDAIMEVRAIKSPAEIEKLRRAAQISAQAVKDGFESLVEGMTEWQLSQKMLARMFELGATDVRYLTNYAGPRRMWADAMPTDYAIQKGDLVQFDGGCMVDGYWCDFKRMASVGKPNDKDQRFYNIAREGLEQSSVLVKSGVKASDVVKAAFDVNRKNGCGDFVDWCQAYGWQAIGHGLGLDIHERPGLAAGSDRPLETNMVVCVEPFVTLDGVSPFWEAQGKFGLEDVVLVEDHGREVLTSESIISHDLFVA
jgi:Xaa-Pro dipeptidase